MAGASSEEDQNYWPGYVDALTTMTMVLTFIMMVLGVMVFVLSQDAVSSKLGAVGRALKIESRQLEKLNAAEIEAALRDALARKETGDDMGGVGDKLGTEGARIAAGTDPTESGETSAPRTEQASGSVANDRLEQVGLSREAGGKGAQTAGETGGKSPFVSTFTGGLHGERTAGPGGEYLVTDQPTGVAGREHGVGGRTEPGPGALRFVFERGAIELPPVVAEALQAYIAAEGSGELLVEASAVANEGGPSDARRKAYFRAMLIRSRLIKLGVNPLQIVVRVRDASQFSALETVDIMKARGGG